jgi:hypothetical protein
VRPERVDEPASSTALLAVRVELSAQWPPPKNKKNYFFGGPPDTHRRVELRDEDVGGHVPVTAECQSCAVTDSSSGVADGPLVVGANTPLRLTIKF